MKLTQLFSGEVRSENTGHAQMTPAQAEAANRHVRSFTPGQTISGEIVSRNGNEVQIKLSDDMVLSARVDRNLNIEIGKNMTFEVKNNGSALTLSPLFTNVSTDLNVLKALDMAGLPVNEDSVSMTKQLMAAGLPVNKSILQQVYREINHFPKGENFPLREISDIVNLHKLQMPVNEANMNQMASYRNLTHHLMEGMDTILEALPDIFKSMAAEGDARGAAELYREIFMLLSREGQEGAPVAEGGGMQGILTDIPQGGEGLPEGAGEGVQAPDAAPPQTTGENVLKEVIRDVAFREGEETLIRQEDASGRTDTDTASIPGDLREAVAREVNRMLDDFPLPAGEEAGVRARLAQFVQGGTDAEGLFDTLALLGDNAGKSAHSMHAFGKLLSGKAFRQLLGGRLKDDWTLRPQELARPGKLEELYRRLDRQLKSLSGALERAGQNETPAFRATASMSQNVDFLHQINQMYAYVQLPLKMQQGEAHGELYVYANKKNLAGKDGKVSALLHLDLEHLGPVDVYVSMQNTQVNTRFYLRDEEMIDFIGKHMDILTRRLKQRGYDCSFAMSTRKEGAEETTKGGLEPILSREKGVILSQYAFDVRT